MVHLEDAIRVGRFDNFLRQKQKTSSLTKHSYSYTTTIEDDKRDDCNTCRGNNDDVNITAETSPMDISNISSISGGCSLAASPNKLSHDNNIIMSTTKVDEDKKSSQRYDQLFKTFNTEEQQQQQQSPILVTPSKYDSQAEGDSDSRIKIIMEAREVEGVSCQPTAAAFIPSCPPPPQMKYEFADDGYSPSLLFEEEYNDSTEGAVDKPQQQYNAPINNHRASRDDSPTFSPPIIPIGRNLSTISDLSGSIKIRKTPPPSPNNRKKNNNTMRRESSFASFIDTLYDHLCGNECGIAYVCSASCYGIEKTKEDRMKEAEDTFLGKKICCPRMMPECGYDNDIFGEEEEENEGNTTPASATPPSKNDMMIPSPTTTATNLNKHSLRWL